MLKQFTNYQGKKQDIDFSLALGANEGSSQKANNKYIIAHSTATPNATAKNEAQYFKNNWSKIQTYVHFFVDDTGVYASGEQGYVAWGAGATGNANSPAQVELCEFTDKTKALNAYKNYVNLLRDLAKDCGLNNTLYQGITTHARLAQTNHETNHVDPDLYLNSLGISMEQFKKDLASGFSGTSDGTSLPQTGMTTNSKRFKVTVGLAKYKKADFSNQVGTLKANEVVEYTEKLTGKSYTWLKLKDGTYIPAVQNAKNYGVFVD